MATILTHPSTSRLGRYEVVTKTKVFPQDCWITMWKPGFYLAEVESAEGFTVFWVPERVLEEAVRKGLIRQEQEL